MNRPEKLLKSKKYLLMFSMILTVLTILFFRIILNVQEVNLELIIAPSISLIGGPYALLGFSIVECGHILLSGQDEILPKLISLAMIIAANMLLWKLWYSVMNRYGYEIPNLGRLYNIVKLIILFLIYMIITRILLKGLENGGLLKLHLQYNIYVIIPLSIIIALFAIYLTSKFKIPVYTPKKQIKRLLPEKAYSAILIVSTIIGLLNRFTVTNSTYSLILTVLTLIGIVIYILKPFDENIYKINKISELNLFDKIIASLLLIFAISAVTLNIPLNVLFNYSYETLLYNISTTTIEFFILFLIPVLIYLYFLERTMINPINKLSQLISSDIDSLKDYEKTKKVLESLNTHNELNLLAKALLKMEEDLINYSGQLIEVTSQKERFETEIELARDIQDSMIRKDFEEFSRDKNCEIWGLMEPAREVAGDFYDYFRIDDDTIGFVIGDVAGKGITSALIMVKAMTLIQDYTKHESDLTKVFCEVNNILCQGNIENIFVTCWLARLNMKTGKLSFVNAGHTPPLLKQGKGFEYLSSDPNLVLGLMEDISYDLNELQLNNEDTLFLYTDGIVEANNNYKEFYGEERLNSTINKHAWDDLEVIINSIKTSVDEFCDNQERFDDTTMFIVKWKTD